MALKPPRIGELRERVEVMRWRDVPAGDADIAPEFRVVGIDWAKIEPVGESILHGSVQTGERVTHRMYVRYRDDLTAAHVVVWEGVRYRVRRVTNLMGGHRFTVAMLEEWGDAAEGVRYAPHDRGIVWE